MVLVNLQIGKNGLTKEFIENLKRIFETKSNESIRVSLLKSSTRDSKEVKKWSEEILKSLGPNFTCNIIGYTLVLRKWRKARDIKSKK